MSFSIQTYYLDAPPVRGRAFDVHVPETIDRDVALFIVHGGGWRAGTKTAFHEHLWKFGKRGFISAATDYRLDAADAFEQLSDIRATYDAFISQLKLRGRPLKVAVYGESAGAHLASLLCCAPPGACGENVELSNPWVPPVCGLLQAAPASFRPWENIFPPAWHAMQNIAGEPYGKNPELYERLSLDRFIGEHNPRLFFMEAENENMFPPTLNAALAARHRQLGIASFQKVYRDMEHGFWYEFTRPQQREAFEDILAFIDNRPIQTAPNRWSIQ